MNTFHGPCLSRSFSPDARTGVNQPGRFSSRLLLYLGPALKIGKSGPPATPDTSQVLKNLGRAHGLFSENLLPQFDSLFAHLFPQLEDKVCESKGITAAAGKHCLAYRTLKLWRIHLHFMKIRYSGPKLRTRS